MFTKLKTISSLASYFKTVYASQKSQKFLAKQIRDIEIFGTRHYKDGNVPAEIIEKYTPFRRLSKKTGSLSNSKYFIEKFESENKNEIPKTGQGIFYGITITFAVLIIGFGVYFLKKKNK